MKISETLLKAADLIEKDGFTKGFRFVVKNDHLYASDHGMKAKHCAVGAIEHVTQGYCSDLFSPYNAYEVPTVLWVEMKSNKSLPLYNDMPSMRKGKMVTFLRKMAAQAKEEEDKLPPGEELAL